MDQATGYIVGGIIITIINQLISFLYNKHKDKSTNKSINFSALVEGFQNKFAEDNQKFREEVLDQKEELRQQLEKSQQRYEEVKTDYDEVLKQLSVVHKELKAKEEKNVELQNRVKTLEEQNKKQHSEITKLQSVINNMKKGAPIKLSKRD